jgi:hypothetical protein
VPHLPPETAARADLVDKLRTVMPHVTSPDVQWDSVTNFEHLLDQIRERAEEGLPSYASVGELQFIDWDDTIDADSATLKWRREKQPRLETRRSARGHRGSLAPKLQPGIGVLAQIIPNVENFFRLVGLCLALSSTLSGNWWRCKVHMNVYRRHGVTLEPQACRTADQRHSCGRRRGLQLPDGRR